MISSDFLLKSIFDYDIIFFDVKHSGVKNDKKIKPCKAQQKKGGNFRE
jgi:hypothetical protein